MCVWVGGVRGFTSQRITKKKRKSKDNRQMTSESDWVLDAQRTKIVWLYFGKVEAHTSTVWCNKCFNLVVAKLVNTSNLTKPLIKHRVISYEENRRV